MIFRSSYTKTEIIMLYLKVAKKTYVGAIFLDSEGTLFSETFKVLVNKVHSEYQFSSSKYVFLSFKYIIISNL